MQGTAITADCFLCYFWNIIMFIIICDQKCVFLVMLCHHEQLSCCFKLLYTITSCCKMFWKCIIFCFLMWPKSLPQWRWMWRGIRKEWSVDSDCHVRTRWCHKTNVVRFCFAMGSCLKRQILRCGVLTCKFPHSNECPT